MESEGRGEYSGQGSIEDSAATAPPVIRRTPQIPILALHDRHRVVSIRPIKSDHGVECLCVRRITGGAVAALSSILPWPEYSPRPSLSIALPPVTPTH